MFLESKPNWYNISHLVKTKFAPNRLRNTRVEGWGRILLAMKTDWRMGKETILETSFYEQLPNVRRPKLPIEKW